MSNEITKRAKITPSLDEIDSIQDKILSKIESNQGQILKSLRQLKVSHTNFFRWLKLNPDIRKRIDEIQEEQVTHVEETYYDIMLKEGDLKNMQYWLSRRSPKFQDKLNITQELTIKLPNQFQKLKEIENEQEFNG